MFKTDSSILLPTQSIPGFKTQCFEFDMANVKNEVIKMVASTNCCSKYTCLLFQNSSIQWKKFEIKLNVGLLT